MIDSLRKQFNSNFTPEKYHAFLQRIDDACGTHVQFRLSETPCFFPKSLLDRMAEDMTPIATIERDAKLEGKNMFMILAPRSVPTGPPKFTSMAAKDKEKKSA